MSEIKDGGPAFPSEADSYAFNDENKTLDAVGTRKGMSLRDWFATHVSERDISEYQEWGGTQDSIVAMPKYTREQARFRYADAMLKARGEAD